MKAITPKLLYYVGLFIPILGLLVFVFLFFDVLSKGSNKELVVVLALFNSFIIIMIFRYVNNYIHLRLDVSQRKIEFGNVFTHVSTDFSDIDEIKKDLFSSVLYKIKIRGRRYKFIAYDKPLLENLINELFN